MLAGRTAVFLAIGLALVSACCQADEPAVTFRMASNESFSVVFDELDEIAQFDKIRPWALLIFLKDRETTGVQVSVLPTKPLEKRVRLNFSFGGGEKPVVKKIAENLYERRANGLVKYILLEADCALMSESRDMIEQIRPRAADYLRMEQKSTQVFVQVHFSRIPDSWKNARKADFAKWFPGLEAGKGFEAIFDATYREVIDGCDTISACIDIDPETLCSRLVLNLTALEGSAFDKSLKLISPVGSRFAGQLDPTAKLNIAIATDISELMSAFLSHLDPKIRLHAVDHLEQQDSFSKLQAEYEEFSDAVGIVAATLLRVRRLDAVLSWSRQNGDSIFNFCAFAPGAQRIETPLTAFFKKAKAIDPTTPGEADVAQHDDVHIHLLTRDSHIALAKDTIVVTSDEKLMHKTLEIQTSDELRQKTPPILIEGDAISVASFLPSPQLAALKEDPTRGEERFRLAVFAKEHSLTADLSLDRALTVRISYYISKQVFGPLTSWFGFKVKPATKPKPAAEKAPVTQNRVDALKPSNDSTGHSSGSQRPKPTKAVQ